jgi:hypothetical protein
MNAQKRFVEETALFHAMLPKLLATDPHKWFIAWDGEFQAIADTFEDACKILDAQPENKDVLVREISKEPLHLPLHFAVTR